MGRYMLHASKSVFAAKYINITKLALLNIGNENPFFDGFYMKCSLTRKIIVEIRT